MKHATLLELLRTPIVLCTITDAEQATLRAYYEVNLASRLEALMIAERYPDPEFLDDGICPVRTCFMVMDSAYTEICSDAESDYTGLRELFYAHC